MYGQRWELLEVVIDQAKLEAYQIGIGPLIQTITMNNRLIAAGDVRAAEGRFAVKVPGLIETGSDLGAITIMTHDEGVVTLSDIADIRRGFADRAGYATYNGRPTIGMAVSKRIGENILETSEAVRATIDKVTADWPENVRVDVSYDESERVGNILTDLQANVVNAILLVMVLVVLALGWKSSLLVGVAIPTSFLLAFLAMTALGMTANMMVMFGLIVAVGMLVDGAIVVVEYADRKIAQGFDRRTAYGAAATRMFWPIIASHADDPCSISPFAAVARHYRRLYALSANHTDPHPFGISSSGGVLLARACRPARVERRRQQRYCARAGSDRRRGGRQGRRNAAPGRRLYTVAHLGGRPPCAHHLRRICPARCGLHDLRTGE